MADTTEQAALVIGPAYLQEKSVRNISGAVIGCFLLHWLARWQHILENYSTSSLASVEGPVTHCCPSTGV